MQAGKIELAAPNICGGLAGKARGLPNDWPTAYLEAPLSQAFPYVRVENDGVAALEAERRWGALQGMANCAYVTWSTGIGMGLCVDGRILRGKNGNAGHAGHTFVSDNAEALCGCGNVGDVEGLIAGNAIARRFGSQGYADASALMGAAQAGDALAIGLVDELCRVMGRTLYNMAATLDLQRISMGGSVFWHHREFLLPMLQQHWQGKFAALTDGLEVVPAGLGLQLGDYAALALVLDAKT
jgi:glucokinase